MKVIVTVFAMFLSAAMGVQAGSIYDIPLKDIDGEPTSLAMYKGKVLLVVNVASESGYTPQYKELEALYRKYKSQGLVVLGFPCNQFADQEPGTCREIKDFCTSKFDVTFPLFEKVNVNGPDRHPLYAHLAGGKSPLAGDIKWSFWKYLIARDGRTLIRFESHVSPTSDRVIAAVHGALAEK